MDEARIPLFPLNAVLFPEGPLSLRIFEPRYLDMVKECTSQQQVFGVCLIVEGSEAGKPALTAQLGTSARICDFFSMEDGLLGIQALGEDKFTVLDTSVRENGLLEANVRYLDAEPSKPLSVRYHLLRSVLGRLLEQVKSLYPDYDEQDLDDAVWVGHRLSELLPLELLEKQSLLECEEPEQRLDRLLSYLPRFQKD